MLLRRTVIGAALIATPLAFAPPALAEPSTTVSCSNPCKPPTAGKTTTVSASAAPSTSGSSSSTSTPQAPWEALTSNGPWEKIWPGKDAKGPWENAVDKLTGGIAKALSPFG